MNNTVKCEFWPDNSSRCDTITILLRIFASLSLFGCLFVISTICLFKLYEYFVQRLILFLCICAGIDSINLLFTSQSNLGCLVQAFIMQYFNWAELLWVCSIALNIVMSTRSIQISRRESLIHSFVWFISLFWSIVPLLGYHYGKAGFWCWISRDATAVRFGVWYIPLMIVILTLFIAYVYVIVKVYRSVDRTDGSDFEIKQKYDMMLNEVKPLVAYPVIYFFFHLPLLITRIDDAIHPDQPPYYPLVVAGVICTPSLGAFNAIAFALYGETLKLLTFNRIRGAFLSFFRRSQVRVTHNYVVLDGDNDLLVSTDEEHTEYGANA